MKCLDVMDAYVYNKLVFEQKMYGSVKNPFHVGEYLLYISMKLCFLGSFLKLMLIVSDFLCIYPL